MQTHDFFTRMIALSCVGPNMAAPETEGECIILYECAGCGDEYDNELGAERCCRPNEIYRCSVCRDKHLDEEDAIACHPRAGAEGQPMQCPICQRAADSFEVAADCCLHTHPTMTKLGRERVAQAVTNGVPWPEAVAANLNH